MKDYLNIQIIEQHKRQKKRKKRKPGDYRNENLYRIKTPCFCIFRWKGRDRLGSITNGRFKRDEKQEKPWYILTDMSEQTPKEVGDLVSYSPNLKKMIKRYKIRILKVRITGIDTITHTNVEDSEPQHWNCRCTVTPDFPPLHWLQFGAETII